VTGDDSLRTIGLGSCVGIALYDAKVKVAGLAHIMLPDSRGQGGLYPVKYADSGTTFLLQRMTDMGADVRRVVAKLAGGAQMFTLAGRQDSLRIGRRNVEAVEAALEVLSIPIVSSSVGGNSGRTIELFADDGRLSIRSVDLSVVYI